MPSGKKTYLIYPLKTLAWILFVCSSLPVYSQNTSSDSLAQPIPDTIKLYKPKTGRIWLVAGGQAVAWTASYMALERAWYADYPKTDFHSFNDLEEWNQMDKAGHAWTAYQLSRVTTELWKWTGINPRKSAWLGSASAMAYQSIIEIQDGFSEEWGFSWFDMAANLIGSGAYLSQQLGWNEQRILIKMSYTPYNYPPDLVSRRDELFGEGSLERILKDYNSQTYWASVNLHSFMKQSRIPKWLNISFGYSSDLMLGGRENKWTADDGTYYDRSDIPRIRRFYLSPDIDLTRIKTNSKFLRSVLFVLNFVKVPAPALEFSKEGLKGHWFYF